MIENVYRTRLSRRGMIWLLSPSLSSFNKLSLFLNHLVCRQLILLKADLGLGVGEEPRTDKADLYQSFNTEVWEHVSPDYSGNSLLFF
jgi:hypothetical protein